MPLECCVPCLELGLLRAPSLLLGAGGAPGSDWALVAFEPPLFPHLLPPMDQSAPPSPPLPPHSFLVDDSLYLLKANSDLSKVD